MTVGSEGSAAIVPAASSVGASVAAAGRSAARADMSRSAVPSPPVRSTVTGASPAAERKSGVHQRSSSAAISAVDQVDTPAASTASTSGSLWPMRPVPRTQPMIAWTKVTRSDQDFSEPHLAIMASSAALASP